MSSHCGLGQCGRRHVLGPRVQRHRDRVVARICPPGAGSPGAGKDLVGPPAEQERVGALEDLVEERLGSSSKSGKAHPPRANPPLRSSSGPPRPCITPSTVTCVMVVSFMGSSFSRWFARLVDCTGARISSVCARRATSSPLPPSRTRTARRRRRTRRPTPNGWPRLARRWDRCPGRLRQPLATPSAQDVDAAGVDQVGGDGEVEAASGPACQFDDAHTALKVGLALLGLDGDVSCNDDHGCASLLPPSCPARPTVSLV